MAAVNIRVNDTEFRNTLRQYVKVNKRALAKIINTKAYRIAIVACHETKRATKADIQKGIGQLVFEMQRAASGRAHRVLTKSGLFTSTAGGYYKSAKGVPIAALILNKLRGKRGEQGLYGAEMKEAIRRLVTKRFSAVAYLASGWLPAIKKLAPLADRGGGLPRPLELGMRLSNPYLGSVIVATESANPRAQITNTAVSKYSTTKDPLTKYGLPALQKGFDVETASMKQYIEDHLKESARSVGIRTA